jgi:hypothetical protein
MLEKKNLIAGRLTLQRGRRTKCLTVLQNYDDGVAGVVGHVVTAFYGTYVA